MTEQGLPPVSTESNVPSGPPVPPVEYRPPNVNTGDLPRRSKAWLWWTVGVVALLTLVVGACSLSIVGLTGTGDGFSASVGGKAVAVIHINGVIAGTGSVFDGIVTPQYFLDLLEQAEDDPAVKAILLRVDSPGGTVAASEELAQYVKECTKPVIVSVGDVGASGAYMLASQSDEIWAMPGSAVGSIGVIAEIPNVGKLLDKFGVEFQVITAGKYKDAGSPYRKLSADERALIQGSVDEAYEQFIDVVADGRKMPRSEVESLATGWAWSGESAKELGLVDELGTYRQALDAAAKRGGIKGDYDIITYEDEFGGLLGSLLGLTSRLGDTGMLSGIRESAVRRSLPQ